MAKEYYLYVKGKAVPVSEEEKQKLEEEERKINERKDRIHQNYLKRKANGKQQEYEERYKARRDEYSGRFYTACPTMETGDSGMMETAIPEIKNQ